MSAPFIEVAKLRAKRFTAVDIDERVGKLLLSWAMLSTNKHVSLDDVAWIGAAIIHGQQAADMDMKRSESRDANGARVVGVMASDGVSVADGAG